MFCIFLVKIYKTFTDKVSLLCSPPLLPSVRMPSTSSDGNPQSTDLKNSKNGEKKYKNGDRGVPELANLGT